MYSEYSIVFVQIQVTVFAWDSNVEYPLHIIYPKPHNRPKCITDDGDIRQNQNCLTYQNTPTRVPHDQ